MTGALILIWLALLAAGETPVGRGMRRWLVERPATWLAQFTRGQVILLGASMLFGVLLFWMMEDEGLRLFAMYAPELMGMVASLELASTIDIIAVAVSTTAMARARGLLGWLQASLPARNPRTSRRRRSKPDRADNDDDGPAPALASAA